MKKIAITMLALLGVNGCAVSNDEEIREVHQLETTAQRSTAINTKAAAVGGLGSATTSSMSLTPAGGYKAYANSTTYGSLARIYYGDNVNRAHLVYGSIASKYIAKGGETFLGFRVR